MMKKAALSAVLIGLFAATNPAFADESPTGQDISQINALLANLKCQMDDEDIEKTADGFRLDDVFCSDGQYDMVLDVDYKVIDKKAE